MRRPEFLLAIALCCAAGCGGGMPGMASPPPEPASTDDLDALERDLEASEAELLEELARVSPRPAAAPPPPPEAPADSGAASESRTLVPDTEGADDASGGEGAPAQAPPAEPAEELAEEEAAPARDDADVVATPGSRCDLACRAFASMQRAADRICEIAGASSSRCVRANERIETAKAQLDQAGCVCF